MLQQTPLAVTLPPPSAEIFPPLDAEIPVMEEMAVVVSVARLTVVNETSLPYEVPVAFVAYALT